MSDADAEPDLLAPAAAGDEAALAALLERHAPAVRAALRGSIPARWQALLSADDVMQQTYFDAFRNFRRFNVADGHDGLVAWLRTIAKRNLLDAIRVLEAEKRGGDRRKVESPADRDGSCVALYEWLGGTSSTPSRKLARGEAAAALDRAIGTLPNIYQTVVRMYDLEDQPVEEVARALDRSPGAIYMLRLRAHRMLCEAMGTVSKYLSRPA